MIDTHTDLDRRRLAFETAQEIVKHPAFPLNDGWPMAMITIIERALKTWEERNK